MSLPRRFLLGLAVLPALLSTGCLSGLRATEAALRVTGAVLEVAAIAAASSPGDNRSGACCYTRENPTPVEGSVDRPMSECELARGRYREAHQDEDDVPPELRCLADGSYPGVSRPSPPPAPPEAETREAPSEQAPAPAAPPLPPETI